MRVVLVRPWTDAHSGGCCSGDARHGICVDGRSDAASDHDAASRLVADAYLRLRQTFPDVDVQIVGANNAAYLLPSTYRAARRSVGVLAALRNASRSMTAGAVLVDGSRIGDLATLGIDGVLAEVAGHLREPDRFG